MPDVEVRNIVLVPRFTSFVGARTFTTQPIQVAAFASATVTAWRGAAIGTTPTFQVIVQQSHDLELWSNLATLNPGSNAEDTDQALFTMPWMRLAITLGGTGPAVSCWAVGDFVTRALSVG